MRRTATALAAGLALSLGLAACETATPYQPLAASNAVSGGFTDQKPLAATPPQTTRRSHPVCSRASQARLTRQSTTASWKLAAKSA